MFIDTLKYDILYEKAALDCSCWTAVREYIEQ